MVLTNPCNRGVTPNGLGGGPMVANTLLASVWAEAGVATPRTRSCAVLNGMITTSSWSWPLGEWPLAASTPITTIGTFLTSTVAPSGSEKSPNKLLITVCPSRHTGVPSSSSCSVKPRPASTRQLRIDKYVLDTPCMLVLQLL